MAIKDGTHLPTNKFRENYNSIFDKKKKEKRLSPETTKQFLERIDKDK
jgi:hypothetical protein